jgi:hypothetical protein
MKVLILSGLCGWGCCCFWWWFWWWFFGRDGWGPEYEPGMARGPLPDPWRRWWPMANGLAGAAGGIAAWTYLGDRFGADGSFGSVALISIVGGIAGVSLLNALGALRAPRVAQPEQPKG